MNRIEELQERIRELKLQLCAEADAMTDAQYADGQAYYDERRRFTRIREELFAAERELTALTVHTCYIPQWIAAERLRVKLDAARKARVDAALKQLEERLGGK